MLELRLLRTTTFRVALLYIWMFTVSVLIILGTIYYTTAHVLDRQTDETIAAELDGLREQYRQHGLSGLVRVIERRSARPRTSALYLITDPFLRPLAGNLSDWPDARPGPDGWMEFDLADAPPEAAEPGTRPLHPARARGFILAGGYRLLVGRDLRERRQFEERLTAALIWAFGLTVGLGSLGGILISRNVVRRVDTINRTVGRIMAGELHQRVVASGSGDEFDQLAANLNAMLARIEGLMGEMRHVAESVAHDLRTPLSRLRTRLELALMEADESEPSRAVLQDALDEADRLLATFQALLLIAEVEAGYQQAGFTEFDLADLAREVAELYEPLAEEKEQTFMADLQPARVRGHRQLLALALANLVDNAIKYTPPGGRIGLAAAPGGAAGSAVLTVTDTGPGIPAADRSRVLRRFVRLDASRSSAGNGLGLAMVDAVARLHGTKLELADADPGLRATLRLGLGAGDAEKKPATAP